MLFVCLFVFLEKPLVGGKALSGGTKTDKASHSSKLQKLYALFAITTPPAFALQVQKMDLLEIQISLSQYKVCLYWLPVFTYITYRSAEDPL